MPTRAGAFTGHAVEVTRAATPSRFSSRVTSRARWSRDEAWQWRERTGWLAGCNFTPSTAGNQLEMWQVETFDPETIDRELGWAAGLGLNSIRVFLHDLLWVSEGDAFLDRVDTVLELAANHGIVAMPVLFDGVWDPDPHLGRQREPRPGVHNSTWVQGPGREILGDRSRWPALRPYVEAVIGRFANDSRVAVWDLFNEPNQYNAISYAHREVSDKTRRVDELLNAIFDWAQGVDPSQPLTAGVFNGVSGSVERASRVNRTMLSRSDVISFHSYAKRDRLNRAIDNLARYDRPLLCTEWLARSVGSTVDLLEVFAERDVDAWCWGFVDGRTQTRFPWTSWLRPSADDDAWFHELFHADGTPYDESEAALIRSVTGS